MVETKKSVDEIMTVTMENTSTEDIPGHFVTSIIIFFLQIVGASERQP